MKNAQANRRLIILFLVMLSPVYLAIDVHADLFGELINQTINFQEDEKIKKENEEAATKEKERRAAMRATAKAEENRRKKWKEARRKKQQLERKRKAEEYKRIEAERARVYELRKKEVMANKPRKSSRYSNTLSKYEEDGILKRAESHATSEISARHYQKLKKVREDAEKLEAEKKATRFRKSEERMADILYCPQLRSH